MQLFKCVSSEHIPVVYKPRCLSLRYIFNEDLSGLVDLPNTRMHDLCGAGQFPHTATSPFTCDWGTSHAWPDARFPHCTGH